jgi:hypothetical protein
MAAVPSGVLSRFLYRAVFGRFGASNCADSLHVKIGDLAGCDAVFVLISSMVTMPLS